MTKSKARYRTTINQIAQDISKVPKNSKGGVLVSNGEYDNGSLFLGTLELIILHLIQPSPDIVSSEPLFLTYLNTHHLSLPTFQPP